MTVKAGKTGKTAQPVKKKNSDDVFYDAREHQLTRPQQDLLARFGLTGDPWINRAMAL